MIKTIQFNNKTYPAFQAEGFAAKFAFPFAKQVCQGNGLDIGCNRPEWALEGAIQVDPVIDPQYDAYNLPIGEFDYIFSSHCLEHLPDWVRALDYWQLKLLSGGAMFLYLPHPDQSYWKPWHNRKHFHSIYPDMIKEYLVDRGWKNIFVTGCDLNHSFTVIAEKP